MAQESLVDEPVHKMQANEAEPQAHSEPEQKLTGMACSTYCMRHRDSNSFADYAYVRPGVAVSESIFCLGPGEELEAALRTQLEYYFSRENLAQDAYLISQVCLRACLCEFQKETVFPAEYQALCNVVA